MKKDKAVAREFESPCAGIPTTPSSLAPQIASHALVKMKERVAPTGTLALEETVRLAVRAHINHCHPEYRLLKDGMARDKVPKIVSQNS